MRAGSSRRGRPVIALATLLLGWVAVRLAVGSGAGVMIAPEPALPGGKPAALHYAAAMPGAIAADARQSGRDLEAAGSGGRAGAADTGTDGRPAPELPLEVRVPPGTAPAAIPAPLRRPEVLPIPVASGHLLIWLDTVRSETDELPNIRVAGEEGMPPPAIPESPVQAEPGHLP